MRLLFVLLFSIAHFNFSDPAEKGLKDISSFPVGIALDNEKLRFEEKYWSVAMSEFNSFTPERILKFSFVHPRKEQFRFEETDELMRFCSERKIRLHGHTLVWHRDLPDWLYKQKGEREIWANILKEHIRMIMKHCKAIKSWDVLNEILNDDGTLRNSIWLQKIGPAYIEIALKEAAEANPDATLFYNDYSLEAGGQKLAATLKLCDSLKRKGCRIDGIGVQMHITTALPDSNEIRQSLRKIADHGYLVHISEMDIRQSGSMFSPKKQTELLANRYSQIVKIYRTIPADKQYGITLWGLSDRDSWLTEDRYSAKPLLFDRRYRKKPAYDSFAGALKN